MKLVTHHFPLVFRTHNLPSCLADKLDALLARGHTKGHDAYDLAWFLTQPERLLDRELLLGEIARGEG
jgi:hypothetical protein